jgi:hypothetical protein
MEPAAGTLYSSGYRLFSGEDNRNQRARKIMGTFLLWGKNSTPKMLCIQMKAKDAVKRDKIEAKGSVMAWVWFVLRLQA